jgi:U3 small nucleolar RNA-associated protein 21
LLLGGDKVWIELKSWETFAPVRSTYERIFFREALQMAPVKSLESSKKRLPRKPVVSSEKNASLNASAIYQPFRALGYVSSDVPFCIQARGAVHYVTVCIGNSYQVYDCNKLHLTFVGPQTEGSVTALAVAGDITFAACGGTVVKLERAQEVGRIYTGSSAQINHLLVFGEQLITINEDDKVQVWNYSTGELYSDVAIGEDFRVTSIVHPATYLNKILLGSQQGIMQLWNIRTR